MCHWPSNKPETKVRAFRKFPIPGFVGVRGGASFSKACFRVEGWLGGDVQVH